MKNTYSTIHSKLSVCSMQVSFVPFGYLEGIG